MYLNLDRSLKELATCCVAAHLDYENTVDEWRRCLLLAVLDRAQGNQCAAAEILGVHRNTLNRWMHELNITVATWACRRMAREKEAIDS